MALAGDYGGTWFLPRLVGSARARELYFLPERIPAEQAERLGILNAIFDSESLEAEVLARAARIFYHRKLVGYGIEGGICVGKRGDDVLDCPQIIVARLHAQLVRSITQIDDGGLLKHAFSDLHRPKARTKIGFVLSHWLRSRRGGLCRLILLIGFGSVRFARSASPGIVAEGPNIAQSPTRRRHSIDVIGMNRGRTNPCQLDAVLSPVA